MLGILVITNIYPLLIFLAFLCTHIVHTFCKTAIFQKHSGFLFNLPLDVDGDRVMSFDQTGKVLGKYVSDTSDAALQKLIDQLNSRDPAAVEAAQLWRQPGSYRCSLPEIDLMVDLACSVRGVAGAQLAGAGLGGCMMVLAHKDCVADLQNVLTNQYYRPRNLEPCLLHCRPIAGAGAISF